MGKPTIEDALALFASGKSPRECEKLTDIPATTIARNAKARGVEKGSMAQLIGDGARVRLEIGALDAPVARVVNDAIDKLTEDAEMIRTLTKNNMVGVGAKLTNHQLLTMLDHKNAQDLIDKASITLGVNERHAKPNNVQQNTQNNTVARVTFRRATKEDRND